MLLELLLKAYKVCSNIDTTCLNFDSNKIPDSLNLIACQCAIAVPESIPGWCDSRDRIVVSTSRCGRDNPGSNPGHGRAVVSLSWHNQPVFQWTKQANTHPNTILLKGGFVDNIHLYISHELQFWMTLSWVQSKPTPYKTQFYIGRLRGATVARLTPDQKVACSNHVGVTSGPFYWVIMMYCVWSWFP